MERHSSGIERVPVPTAKNLFTTKPHRTSTGLSSGRKSALEDVLSKVQTTLPKGPSSSMGQNLTVVPDAAATMMETQEAARRLLGGADALIMDAETIGEAGKNFFDVVEISMKTYNHKTKKSGDAIDLVNRISAQSANTLEEAIRRIERDPMAIHSMDETLKRSLTSLSLYSDESLFSTTTIGGKSVKVLTGHAQGRPSHKGSEMTRPEHVLNYKKGLANLKDKKLTNDSETAKAALAHYTRNNPVLSGHNVIKFDRNAFLHFTKTGESKHNNHLTEFFNSSYFDTLPLYKDLDTSNGFTPKNHQLGTLYNALTPNAPNKTFHFAGDDADASAVLLENALSLYEKGQIKINDQHVVKHGDLFKAERGTGMYKPSDFNRNKGQYDMTVLWDPDTKEWKRNYDDFNEPAISRTGTYGFLGDMGKVELNGKEHYGILMEDKENQTYKLIFRENKDELNELFTDYLKPISQANASKEAYARKDNTRRFYDELFEGKNGKSVVRNLETAYDMIDVYDTHITELTGGGKNPLTDAMKKEALTLTRQTVNDRVKDKGYAYGNSRIEKTIALKDRLQGERDIWSNVIEDARALDVVGTNTDQWRNTKKQNIFIKSVYDQISEAEINPTEPYGYEGMKQLAIPSRSPGGKPTYINVESPTIIEGRVRGMLSIKNKNKSAALLDLNDMFSSAGPALDTETKNRLYSKIEKELTQNKQVSPGTMKELSQILHRAAHDEKAGMGNFVSSIPGKNLMSARSDGTSQRELYYNNLRSREDVLYKRITRQATEHAHSQLSSTSAENFFKFDLANASDPALQKVKKAQEIADYLDESVRANAVIMGLNGVPQQDVIAKTKHAERIQETMTRYQNKGYQVSLDYTEHNDQMLLFFSHEDSGIDLSSLSAEDKLYTDKVNRVTIPLHNTDGSLSIQDNRYRPGYIYKGKTKTVQSTADAAYDSMLYLPERIEDEIKKAKISGQNISRQEAERRAISGYKRKMQQGGVPSSFNSRYSDSEGFLSASRGKNLTPMMDLSEYIEEYAKKNYSTEYKKFESWKERTDNPHAKFLETIEEGTKIEDGFKLRAKARMGAIHEWNTTQADLTGIHVNQYGLNPNQYHKGMVNVIDQRSFTPGGLQNSAHREQIMKVQNYHPMMKEQLEEYYIKRSHDGPYSGQRMLNPMLTDHNLAFERIAGEEAGQVALGARTAFTNDEELNRYSKEAKALLNKEKDSLNAELNTAGKNRRKEIESRIKEIEAGIEDLNSNKLSTYEEQAVVRQSLLDSIQIKDDFTIEIEDGSVLAKQLEDYITEQNGGVMLERGRLTFGQDVDYDMMQNQLGIVNKKGELTVGTLVSDMMEEEGVEQAIGTSKRRIDKQSRLKGIERTKDGKTRVFLENIRKAEDGFKAVETAGGTRTTLVGFHDTAMDALSTVMTGDASKKFDMIRENIKDSRTPTGQLFANIIQTAYENAMSDFDRVYLGEAGELGLVNQFAKNGLGANYETEKARFIDEVFLPKMNEAGVGEMLSAERSKSGDVLFNSKLPADYLTGDQGFLKYQSLYKVGKDDFGVDNNYMVSGFSAHNVSAWHSRYKFPRISVRELDILEETFTDMSKGKLGKDSLVMKKYNELTKGDRYDMHHEFAQGLTQALQHFETHSGIQSVEGAGNVIIDMTGRVNNDGHNVVKQVNEAGEAFFLIDGLSIAKAPERIGRKQGDTVATGADLFSVTLTDSSIAQSFGKEELTVGELIKETGGAGFLQINDSRTPYGKKMNTQRDVVPIIPKFKGFINNPYEEVHQYEAEKQMENIFNSAKDFYNLTFDGTLTHEQQMKYLTTYAGEIQTSTERLQEQSQMYLLNSSKGSLSKSVRTLDSENGVAGLSGMYNVFGSHAKMNETFVSKEYAESLIRGNEFDILRANNLYTEGLSEKEARETIISRLTGATDGSDDFRMTALINRQPSQSEGSLAYTDIRIDSNMKEDGVRIMINPQLAKLLRADNDGDTLYLNTAHYTNLGNDESALAMQAELDGVRDYFTHRQEQIKESFDMLGDTFDKIANLDPSTPEGKKHIDTMFQAFTGDSAEILAALSNEIKTPGIGRLDNTLVAGRQAMQYAYKAAQNGGVITGEQYNAIISDWDAAGDQLVQGLISSKKLNPESLAVGGVNFDQLTWEEKLDKASGFLGDQNAIPGMIRNLTGEGVDDLIEKMRDVDALGDNEELFRRAFNNFAVMNESLHDAGMGGMYNASFSIARSSSKENVVQTLAGVGRNPENYLPTNNMISFVDAATGENSKFAQKLRDAESIRQERLGSAMRTNYEKLINRSTQGEMVAANLIQTSGDQFEQMSSLVSEFASTNRVNSQNKVIAELQQFGGELVKSKSFQAGAGMAAMWMLSSAVKRGPTPEGAEAEEEFASAAEVNPSALLTSPTARVTPRGEDIQLSISGRGNVNRDAIAGIVNNEISQMTHAQLNMNINVTDNTQRLDRGFYQKAVNRALGV